MNQLPAPRRRPLFLAVLGPIALCAAGCAPKAQDAVLATVGDYAITVGEYERQYAKSNTSRDQAERPPIDERERFLDLLIKYRLKVADAYRQRLDRSNDVVSEIRQYKGSLAASFLTDREVISPGVRQLYDRRLEEIRASHILLDPPKNTPSSDSADIYQKAYEIIREAKAGTDFGLLALSLSKDPSVQSNKGDLYYFTAGQMVPAFEDAVYSLKPGEVSRDPVRTTYGLHIVKVTDRRPASGEIRAAHIMVRFQSQDPTPEDTAAAYLVMKTIQDSVMRGLDFGELAQRNSGDPGSAPRGGDLGWFSRRRWVQPFDEAAFKLRPGQVSGIIRTSYGYHLIKCLETRDPKSFEESKQELSQLYQQVRFQDEHARYIAALKKEVRFARNDSVTAALFASLDSTRTTRDSGWASTVTPELGRTPMMTVGGSPVSVDSVIALIGARQDLSNIQLRASHLNTAVERVAEHVIFSAKSDLLEKQNPEFASLLGEYKEAILLYQVEQENVWSRVQASDSVLRAYFLTSRDRFTWPDRVRFSEIRAGNEVAANALDAMVRDGRTLEDLVAVDSARMQRPTRFEGMFSRGSATIRRQTRKTLDDVVRELKADTLLRVILTIRPDTSTHAGRALTLASRRLDAMKKHLIGAGGIPDHRVTISTMSQQGTGAGSPDIVFLELTGRQPRVIGKLSTFHLSPENDERARRADSLALGEISTPFFFKAGYSIIRVEGREPARHKTYEEAAPEVATAYQDYESKRLEARWLDSLRSRFPVRIHREQLARAFPSQQ